MCAHKVCTICVLARSNAPKIRYHTKLRVLNIAEAEPWSDGGWTKVASKFKETPLATNRQATESPHDNEQCEDMKVNHHNGNVKGDRMCKSDRNGRGQKQRFSWGIEQID